MIIESGENLEVLTDAVAAMTEPSWSVGVAAGTGATYTQASSEAGACTGTTAVVMVAGAVSTQKRILSFTVYNRDIVPRTITIRRSATLPIIKATIAVGGTFGYEAGEGFKVYAL